MRPIVTAVTWSLNIRVCMSVSLECDCAETDEPIEMPFEVWSRWGFKSHALSVVQNPPGTGWLGSRVVSVLDSRAEGPGFKSKSRRFQVTVLGKLFTPIVPLFIKQRNW